MPELRQCKIWKECVKMSFPMSHTYHFWHPSWWQCNGNHRCFITGDALEVSSSLPANVQLKLGAIPAALVLRMLHQPRVPSSFLCPLPSFLASPCRLCCFCLKLTQLVTNALLFKPFFMVSRRMATHSRNAFCIMALYATLYYKCM